MSRTEQLQLSVIMDDSIALAIDESISGPLDALIATQQIIHELPALHRKCRRRRRFRRFPKAALPIYRGLIDWCGAGFAYVEFEGHLHILGVYDVSAREADTIIDHPEDPTQYVRETPYSEGVSILG